MPLPDNPFERGKCGSKLLQYMACNIPAIASPVGVNSQIVAHGVTGFLAKNEDEWFKYMLMLIDDENLRRKLGDFSREKVEESYSLERYSIKLANVMKCSV